MVWQKGVGRTVPEVQIYIMVISYCLPFVTKIDSSGDLGNQLSCQVFTSVFLMNAQEVDFTHFYFLFLDSNMNGNPGDRADHLVIQVFVPNANQPFWLVSRRSKSPLQELSAVVESEDTVFIGDVVVGEKVVELRSTAKYFIELLGVFNLNLTPLQPFCEFVRVLPDFLDGAMAFDVSMFNLIHVISESGLLVPEPMFLQQ